MCSVWRNQQMPLAGWVPTVALLGTVGLCMIALGSPQVWIHESLLPHQGKTCSVSKSLAKYVDTAFSYFKAIQHVLPALFQLLPKVKGTDQVQTRSTLFDVEVIRDFLCYINKHSVVLTNTQGVNSIHSHRCEGWWELWSLRSKTHPVLDAPVCPPSFCFLSRTVDVGQPVRSHRWIRQAAWNTALVLCSCRNTNVHAEMPVSLSVRGFTAISVHSRELAGV